jgi:hypothetical protein
MRTVFLAAMLFQSPTAWAESPRIIATVSEQQEDKRVLYKVTLSNVGASQRALIVSFGASCSLGKQIDHERYEFDLLPITNGNGSFKPNVIAPRDNFVVDVDNYLKLSSIEAVSGNEKLPFIDQNARKEVQFYTGKKSSNLMFNLPLCVQVVGGEKDEVEVILSEEQWVESDNGFDIESSIKVCRETFPGAKLDPNTGSHASQCKDPKYRYLAVLPSLQYSCVLEKRLQHRLANAEKNSVIKIAREKANTQPSDLKLQAAYNEQLESIRKKVAQAISKQIMEIAGLKTNTEKILVSVDKGCKK